MNSTPTFARMERPSAEAKGSSRPGRAPGSTRGEDPATERTRRHRWWSGCARCDGMAAAEAEAAAARGWGTATATATATATGSRIPNAGVSAPRSGGRSSSTCDAGRSWSRPPGRFARGRGRALAPSLMFCWLSSCVALLLIRVLQTHAAAAAAASSASDFVFPLAAAAAPSFRFFLFANAICHARFTPPVAAPAPAPRARALGVDPVAKLTMPALTPSGSGSNRNPPCCHCGCTTTAHFGHARVNRACISSDATMSSSPLNTTMSRSHSGPRSHDSCGNIKRFISCCTLASPFTNHDARTRFATLMGSPGSAARANKCSSISVHVARWSSWPYRR
eukprot:22697-Pelagococcus_subviridis.AAC.6